MWHKMDEDHRPVPCDVEEWGKADRKVALDMVGDYRVSTVFLGYDAGPVMGLKGRMEPRWFETMVFGGGGLDDEYQQRYKTYEEALAGHTELVGKMERGEEWP